MTDLHDLSKPFPSRYVHKNPSGGGEYVPHHIVNQRLLQVLGPFDFELVQIIRGVVPGRAPNPQGKSDRARSGTPEMGDSIVGAVCRLTLTVDGAKVRLEEVGDCEEPNNWPHDGARLKDAMSDALKRCAMRVGCGLHLWSQDEYYLFDRLGEAAGSTATAVPAPERMGVASQTSTNNGVTPPVGGGRSAPAGADEDRRREHVNAAMGKAGVTGDDRHALIRFATKGAAASSAGLTAEQELQVVTTAQAVVDGFVVLTYQLDGSPAFAVSEPVDAVTAAAKAGTA